MQPMQFHPYPPPAPRRSAVPKVVGIIALVFSWVGLGGSVLFTFGPLHDLQRHSSDESFGFALTWVYLWAAASFVIFILHLVGAILALLYRTIGLRLLTAYAVAALMLVLLDMVILYGFMPGGYWVRTSLTFPRTLFALLAAPWPIIVLVLVNLQRSKQACR